MYQSNKLCNELLSKYTDFKKYDKESFTGYKLVQKTNLNYYSIVTGMFRYRVKRVSEGSYHELHRKYNDMFVDNLIDRLAIFKDKSDAYKSLIHYSEIDDRKGELVMLEIKISGNLEIATCENDYVKGFVIIGDTIDSIKEVT